MTSHLVVVGMGAAESNHAERLRVFARAHHATLAYLQIGEPSLRAELTRLADAGAREIVLVGAALGPAPGNSWLRRAAARWWRERGSSGPEIVVASGLLDNEADDLNAVLRRARPITGTEAGLNSAASQEMPGHRHHVFVCRGPGARPGEPTPPARPWPKRWARRASATTTC